MHSTPPATSTSCSTPSTRSSRCSTPTTRWSAGTFNAGSGGEISIGDLVKLIAVVMDAEVEVTLDPDRIRPSGSEVMRLVCDSDAAAGGHVLEAPVHAGRRPRPDRHLVLRSREPRRATTPTDTTSKEDLPCTQISTEVIQIVGPSRSNGHNGSTSATGILTLERPIVTQRDARQGRSSGRDRRRAARACACGRTPR